MVCRMFFKQTSHFTGMTYSHMLLQRLMFRQRFLTSSSDQQATPRAFTSSVKVFQKSCFWVLVKSLEFLPLTMSSISVALLLINPLSSENFDESSGSDPVLNTPMMSWY
ncbi:uncharacterized protein LOC110446036 [Mizuhopecten yessoensis]|uniref:uncharacterized protein LOC110446036 n=1 Tax=Mizuhopecten yessoensis TaxID=6573 RepID=UPI000B45F010|nr:uncharacterized protein LOC110446036 [Mizuhopecten yessoensis]